MAALISRGYTDSINSSICPTEKSLATIKFPNGELPCLNYKDIFVPTRCADYHFYKQWARIPFHIKKKFSWIVGSGWISTEVGRRRRMGAYIELDPEVGSLHALLGDW